jgi:hypothetical protein
LKRYKNYKTLHKTAVGQGDLDMDKNFECNRWPYVLIWPFTQILILVVMIKKTVFNFFGFTTKINSLFFDGLGETCNKVKKTRGSVESMREIYEYRFGVTPGLKGSIGDFWQGCLNCQALRNRLRLLLNLFDDLLNDFSEVKELRILSLASGDGRSVMTFMASSNDSRIRAMFIDKDELSLRLAKEFAQSLNVIDRCQFVLGNAFDVEDLASEFKPHIVEVAGLMEYLLDEEAVELFRRINLVLVDNGRLIVSNVRRNIESRFVTWVIDWPMQYREAIELENLMYSGGCVDISFKTEPLKMHTIAVGRK